MWFQAGLAFPRRYLSPAVIIATAVVMLCQNGQAQEKPTQAAQANNYPVVLLHGFTGWGRNEMAGYKYWGGLTDLQAELRDSNYPVYTATVGPISSNWDRACDFYAFVKGGRVDYGKAHSEKHGHERFGRSHDGILPLWGESKAEAKIHIVGHSLGAQTARVLTSLLNAGSTEERAASGGSFAVR